MTRWKSARGRRNWQRSLQAAKAESEVDLAQFRAARPFAGHHGRAEPRQRDRVDEADDRDAHPAPRTVQPPRERTLTPLRSRPCMHTTTSACPPS